MNKPEQERTMKLRKGSVMTKDFHVGDILSITTGALVSPRHIEGVYDILNWMTGDNLFTHQLPRACRECSPHLLKQHPQLAAADRTGVTSENWRSWLDERVAEFGETLPVAPLPALAHTVTDPIQELCEMVGPEKVVVVKVAS